MNGKGKQFLARMLMTGCGILALSATAQAQCGKERWPVKTLQDESAEAVINSPVKKATVSQLLALQAPPKAQLLKAETTRFLPEASIYQVEVLILGFKQETDSDFHIVISDPQNPGKTMISEIPSGSCADIYAQVFTDLQKQFVNEVGKPTPKYRKLLTPIKATFTGPAFFDFLHGQTGVAANGIELHPLIRIQVHQ